MLVLNPLKVGDDIEVVVLDDETNMFHGQRGKVVRKSDNDYYGNPSVSVDWYGEVKSPEFTAGRTLFSTDKVMNQQYRFIKESFDWTDEIPEEIDVDLWMKVTDDIDNEVSGPYSGSVSSMFPKLTKVLSKYNIDIDDMGSFFMYPPDGPKDMDGNHITNYQLIELQKDLIRIGISLTPEQERDLNLESVNESDFDWASEAPDLDSHRFFDINVCYVSYYNDETGEDECREGGSYHLKIPREVVPEIWDYEAEDSYIAGPGDEGYDVIQWCIKNNLIDDTDFDDVVYVTELDKETYCRAWGDWQEEDKGLCKKQVIESDMTRGSVMKI